MLCSVFREPSLQKAHAGLAESGEPETAKTAWGHLLAAGGWIVRTPVALFVLVAGLLLDSVVRLFLTFSSSYFRLIHLPEASFGIIGACFAGLGFVVSPMARRMVKTYSLRMNYLLLAGVVLFGLVGVALEIPMWGVVFMFPLGAVMTALGFMVSYYLNALVDSRHRATVLSFRGLAFNLGYGFIGLLFALVLKAFQQGGDSTQALAQGFELLPLWLVLVFVVVVIAFWRKSAALGAKI